MTPFHQPFKTTLTALFLTLPLACSNDPAKDTGDNQQSVDQTNDDSSDNTDLAALASQVSQLVGQVGELSEALAASEAKILQLQNETLRWEVVEHVCSGVSDPSEQTSIYAQDALFVSYSKIYTDTNGDDTIILDTYSNIIIDETTGLLKADCYHAHFYPEIKYIISLAYQR